MNFKFFLFVILIVGISFSRIKTDYVEADSVNSTKNITAPSVKLTNLTSGYFPYQNNSGILANGPIFTNGTNVSVCKTSIENWNSSYRALQIGANTAIMANANETEYGNGSLFILRNAYFDGAWKPQMSGQSQILDFGPSGVVYKHDTGVVADSAFSPTTRFGWTFAGGLNVASKGTFTNLAAGDTVSAKKGLFDSLKLGSGNYLKNYVEGSFPCTLKTSDVTVQKVGTISYTVIGNIVYLSFPNIYGTSNSTTLILYCGDIPASIVPSTLVGCPVYGVTDQGISNLGRVDYSSTGGKYFYFYKESGNFTASGTKGLTAPSLALTASKFTITYMK